MSDGQLNYNSTEKKPTTKKQHFNFDSMCHTMRTNYEILLGSMHSELHKLFLCKSNRPMGFVIKSTIQRLHQLV